MNNWRDVIDREFISGTGRPLLVADPDSLLSDAGLLERIRDKGFDLVEFEDPIEFRYLYESRFRGCGEENARTLVVVVKGSEEDLLRLPFDLFSQGQKLTFSVAALFPNLDPRVLSALGKEELDTLYEVQKSYPFPGMRSETETLDYILLNVYQVAAQIIKTPADLLKRLLGLHYGDKRLPDLLAQRLVTVLRSSGKFTDWPLEEIVPGAKAFYEFLQERWPIFLGRIGGLARVQNPQEAVMRYEGPDLLPFEHQDVLVYMDNLFAEGKLAPVDFPGFNTEGYEWVLSGIKGGRTRKRDLRGSRLLAEVENEIPCQDCDHQTWLEFASKWAEASFLAFHEGSTRDKAKVEELQGQVNRLFCPWLLRHFGNLGSMPPVNPVMVHHLPRYLARQRLERKMRQVLIVIDGLALSQWHSLKANFSVEDHYFRETALFAWIPTLTSVSRQAIFSGKMPLFFAESISSTHKEPSLWSAFWQGEGLRQFEVAYMKGLGDGEARDVLEGLGNLDRLKAVGLVVDKVDRIMHGMEMGASGMYNQVSQWAQTGYLVDLVDIFLDLGFSVCLTSDHGNVESVGVGKPSEGLTADVRGERARIFSSVGLREQVASKFPNAVAWEPLGLPKEYFPLLAQGTDAFVSSGKRTVAHGGISVEEVIVPFVEIERRRK